MGTSLRRGAFAAAMGCMVVHWASSAHAQCTKDTDCKGDRICNDGACMDPTPPAALAPLPAPEPPAAIAPPAPTSPGAIPDAIPDASRAPRGDESAAREESAVATEPRSPAMATTGLVLTALGTVSLVTTAILAGKGVADQNASESAFCSDNICSRAADTQRSAGDTLVSAAMLSGIITAALLGTGIPLFFVGRHQVPAHGQGAAWWVPQRISTGLRQVTLTYAF
jgi:hypothetical protein